MLGFSRPPYPLTAPYNKSRGSLCYVCCDVKSQFSWWPSLLLFYPPFKSVLPNRGWAGKVVWYLLVYIAILDCYHTGIVSQDPSGKCGLSLRGLSLPPLESQQCDVTLPWKQVVSPSLLYGANISKMASQSDIIIVVPIRKITIFFSLYSILIRACKL